MFVIFSLPRSRSAWLSVFLSRPGAMVGHDIGIECASPAEFAWKIHRDLVGTCETGAAFAWPLIRKLLPQASFVVIKRDPQAVQLSLQRLGLVDPDIEERTQSLGEISALPGTLTVDFENLRKVDVCANLYDYCLNMPMNRKWWKFMDGTNVQIDMVRRLNRLAHNREQIEALKAQVRREIECTKSA